MKKCIFYLIAAALIAAGCNDDKNVAVVSVQLNKATLELVEDTSEKLEATVSPPDATNQNLTWSSSNDEVASVAADGTVTAHKAGGPVTITVTTVDGGKIDVCAVTVLPKTYPVTNITFTESAKTLNVGDDFTLVPIFTPSNASNKNVDWTSIRSDVASVDQTGKVIALKPGETTITVTSKDNVNIKASCIVTVPAILIANIGLPASLSITVGQMAPITATITPENATNKNLTWESSDKSIADVNEDGVVTGIAVGAVTITATAQDGSDVSAECRVSVTPQEIDHSAWTITTQTGTNYGYVPDGTTGMPEHLFDGNLSTFLSLVKPGKSYAPVPSQPATFNPGFTVDMQSPQKFSFIKWAHRFGNNYNYLRVFAINVFGSDDGTVFTKINTEGLVWIPNRGGYSGSDATADSNIYWIPIPESTYRHVKIVYEVWSDIYFGEHPDYPGTGAGSGSTMQVSEFGLGN